MDTGVGIRAAWAHPGTRLAFWSHFTTPFAGTAFVLLWGMPFLTAGEGSRSRKRRGAVDLCRHRHGPRSGHGRPLAAHSAPAFAGARAPGGRDPVRRVDGRHRLAGPAPLWLLYVLAFALAMGGPASMIAFDHARTHNPAHRLSTATGITNVGGFLAALVAIFAIGLALDLQGAGTPDTYRLDAFRLAFLTQVPLWALGWTSSSSSAARPACCSDGSARGSSRKADTGQTTPSPDDRDSVRVTRSPRPGRPCV
jgi:hypothetical protein